MPGALPSDPLLAIETSGPLGSVAVASEGAVASRGFLTDARSHAIRILETLDRTLAEANLTARELTGVVVGSGPGSFTGVRIAAATAKGFAHALGIRLWAISSLAAAAVSDVALPAGAGPDGMWRGGARPRPLGPRCVLFDARGGRVYAACYLLSEAGFEVLRAPHATDIADLLAGPLPENVTFAGEGASANRDAIEGAGFHLLAPPAGVPTADGLLHVLGASALPPLDDPAGWEPDYLRSSNAERERGS